MSIAEIADNRWELEASRPPIRTLTGIAEIAVMAFLSLFFVGIVLTAIAGIFMTTDDSVLGQSKKPPAAATK